MLSATATERRELDRVGAFSDGVFAIAITLLVLNIDVPDVPGSDLGSAISDLSDDFVAYGIGFAVIGLFWYEHHKLFASLGRASGRLVLVNTALLALIALMPFTTAVLGRYDEPLAVALYAGNVGLTIIFGGLMTLVAMGGDRYADSEPDPSGHRRREVIVSAASRALVFLISIPIAYEISQSLAKWFWLLLLVLSVPDRRRARRRGQTP
ncbi:TMEM175 family protein [Baekduia sp.]|jgi:uncharacterized membrane protein|uniref:TMEM175 family protein n=1 Tax=Baekduia sp. TaxID=2600305 RepID=UPI002E095B83|nr:TMEM175 family protein [Baekduia sp.]